MFKQLKIGLLIVVTSCILGSLIFLCSCNHSNEDSISTPVKDNLDKLAERVNVSIMWQGREIELQKKMIYQFEGGEIGRRIKYKTCVLTRDGIELDGYLTVRNWIDIPKLSVEVSRATWEEVRIYFDGQLRTIFPMWEGQFQDKKEDTIIGHWFLDIVK